MKRGALLFLLLAACAVAETPLPIPENDTCNAAPYAELIGQDVTALEEVLIMQRIRILRPEQPMTMDFWPDRINFLIDENERISRFFCG
jgi:hypothetical protein